MDFDLPRVTIDYLLALLLGLQQNCETHKIHYHYCYLYFLVFHGHYFGIELLALSVSTILDCRTNINLQKINLQDL